MVRAEGTGTDIVGHLFYYGADETFTDRDTLRMPAGGRTAAGINTKILWLVDNDQRTGWLEMTGTNLSGGETIFTRFSNVAPSTGAANEFPSIIQIPEPGCWELRITAGETKGRVVVDVIGAQQTAE